MVRENSFIALYLPLEINLGYVLSCDFIVRDYPCLKDPWFSLYQENTDLCGTNLNYLSQI